MEQTTPPVPKVFISYSHDSPDHKRWVSELATKLMENGIDIIFDQWDLGLGDDVPKFMEKSVTEADRVLMICTDRYVHKADEGSGGVGYEAMVVTGELVKNLGTSKFIPIIRQGSDRHLLPKSVSTRLFVNLSEGQNIDEQFDYLLRELHEAPQVAKPPLGKNPFRDIAPVSVIENTSRADQGHLPQDPSQTFDAALRFAENSELLNWQKLISQIKQPIPEQIAKWRTDAEKSPPKLKNQLPAFVMSGAAIYGPLFSIALAGVASGKQKFTNQASILDEVRYPKHWNRGGLTILCDFPETSVFLYQGLHGATCLRTYQLSLAMQLARTRVEANVSQGALPLFRHTELIGWPASLGGNSKLAWDFLMNLPEQWTWLGQIFGHLEDYQIALCTYYMALNILEFADLLARGEQAVLDSESITIDVPIHFIATRQDIRRKAYRLLLHDEGQVKAIWTDMGLNHAIMKQYWPKWVNHIAKFARQEFRLGLVDILHKDLLMDLRL